MDLKKFLSDNNLNVYPSGFSGCRSRNSNNDSCDFDIVIFDNGSDENVIEYKDELIFVHHSSLYETKSNALIHFDGMKIINDDEWELRILLSKIKERRDKLFRDFAKNCLIEASFCCQKARNHIDNSDFAPCWQKCASVFLGSAISALNFHVPSSHTLYNLRQLEKNTINQNIKTINETVGIERATPSLLERMCKSTIGFSDMVEKNNRSKIIKRKVDYFIRNSMFSDCYYYLCQTNQQNFIRIKHSLHRQADLIHLLKIAFDIEKDPSLLEQQSFMVQNASTEILKIISGT